MLLILFKLKTKTKVSQVIKPWTLLVSQTFQTFQKTQTFPNFSDIHTIFLKKMIIRTFSVENHPELLKRWPTPPNDPNLLKLFRHSKNTDIPKLFKLKTKTKVSQVIKPWTLLVSEKLFRHSKKLRHRHHRTSYILQGGSKFQQKPF